VVVLKFIFFMYLGA